MAIKFDYDKLIKASLKVIKKEKLCFHSHVSAHIGIGAKTYYQRELHLNEEIIQALEMNKVSSKTKLLSKMCHSDSTGSHIFAYKLLSSQEERDILNDSDDKKQSQEPITLDINIIKN